MASGGSEARQAFDEALEVLARGREGASLEWVQAAEAWLQLCLRRLERERALVHLRRDWMSSQPRSVQRLN